MIQMDMYLHDHFCATALRRIYNFRKQQNTAEDFNKQYIELKNRACFKGEKEISKSEDKTFTYF